MIYTNNQGPPGWIDHIKEYFEAKISYKLFDQVVAAFKINGKKTKNSQETLPTNRKMKSFGYRVDVFKTGIFFFHAIYLK